jgi:hypothetical protein
LSSFLFQFFFRRVFSSELQNGSFTSGSRATKAGEIVEKRKGGGFVYIEEH